MRPFNSFATTFMGAVALVATQVQSIHALTSQEVAAIAQAITVRIEGQNPGSGVLIRKQGTTYTVLTAAHVVATEDEYDVMTADGQLYPLDYKRVSKLPGVDLALVEFESNQTYSIVDTGDETQATAGTTIYVAGFPTQTRAITQRIFNFTEGKVTANATQPLADGYSLVYDNSTLPGMSGGAVLNANGQLIGIHGRADGEQQRQQTETVRLKTGFNLAIPISTYLSQRNQDRPLTKANAPTRVGTMLTADDWFLKAGAAARQANYPVAIASYSKAIQLKPDYVEAYLNRGVEHDNFGDFQRAIADFDTVIQLNPTYAKAYNNRGAVHEKLGDSQGAIADYDQAIQLQPDFAKAYLNRGIAHTKLGNLQAAIANYDKAIQLQPDFAEAYNNRSVTHEKLGNLQAAIADYDQAIQLQPDFALAYFNRGVAHRKLGNLQAAIADFDKAIQLQPDFAAAYYTRGAVYYAQGLTQQATGDAKSAAQLYQQQGKPFTQKDILESYPLLLKDKPEATAD